MSWLDSLLIMAVFAFVSAIVAILMVTIADYFFGDNDE